MTLFNITDFNKGYWMVELDPDSKKLRTMALDMEGSNGPDFQWVPLLFGMFFKENTNSIFIDIPGVTGIADHMIIYGR